MKFAIIGGTGLYHIPDLHTIRELPVETPFGSPSAPLRVASLHGRDIVFLARHGEAHTLLPSEINYRANIYALKLVGVTHVISVCAVGSLQEHIHPGDLALPDQFFDRTRGRREDTFFGRGLVAHVSFGDPTCPSLRAALAATARRLNLPCHEGGIYVNIEGPAFSTRAESLWYRHLGGTVIGMTNLTEAKLAREAELCYATIAQVTDYDCWHDQHAEVNVTDILATLQQTTARAIQLLTTFLSEWVPPSDCACQHALQHALVTPWPAVPRTTRDALRAIIAPYLPDES